MLALEAYRTQKSLASIMQEKLGIRELAKKTYFLGSICCKKCGRKMVERSVVLKKRCLIMFVVIFMLIVVLLGVFWLKNNRVKIEFVKDAKACFIYGDTNNVHCLSDEELTIIKDIFNGKRLYKDNPSCGFNEDISIKFSELQTFCIACDACPIIYWKEENRYIRITEDEKEQLYNLLETYGFFFPCV